MGGGDLNMKKSWHPLLLKNQERVWIEEKKALEEKKKLDQLRKEKEEERQLQELQRLQEEKTGKKRTEKLEWMYATPATGSSQNANDLEDYLLGKKRVDKMLTADENAKLGAAHKNFIAVQNANNARDIASKIREDPLLAIKQQEQAAYEALMKNPLRLRQLQEKNGIKPKEDKKEKKKEKEERKKLRHERRHLHDRAPRSRSRSPDESYIDRRRSPTPSYSRPRRSPSPDYHVRSRYDSDRRDRSPVRTHSRERSRSRSPRRHFEYPKHSRSRSPDYETRNREHKRSRIEYAPRNQSNGNAQRPTAAEERAARLAAMSSDANRMSEDRQKRLAEMLEKEKADMEADNRERAKSKGMGNFLSHEQKKVFGGVGGLEDRIRRGKGAMVVDAD